MSKAHDPHWRYVAVKLDGPAMDRRDLSRALGRWFQSWQGSERPQLTRFEWPHAIVKVHHFKLAELRAALDAESGVETMSSSGTIKALTTRLGILKVRGEKKPESGGKPRGVAAPSRGPSRAPGRGPAPAPGGPAAPPGRRRRG